MTMRGDLAAGWWDAVLLEVIEGKVTTWMEHTDFADYWQPIAAGEGTLGRYVSALAPDAVAALREALIRAYISGRPDGPRAFAATASVCRGVVAPT